MTSTAPAAPHPKPSARKIQIAVLGGGGGAMAAAFELTATPELRETYKVTVYQQGWRLGGKGASGRNADYGQRIEEHGLHMLMGFYENAFAMVRQCYEEWDKPKTNAFQTWRDAFKPQRQITLQQKTETDGAADWRTWNLPIPPLPGEPGNGESVSLLELAGHMAVWLADRHGEAGRRGNHKHKRSALSRIKAALSALEGRRGSKDSLAPVLEQIKAARPDGSGRDSASLGDDLERLGLLIELGWTVLKGFVEDILPYGAEGFRRIDEHDFKAWLIAHGASPKAADSAPIRALYDLGFAYRNGDPDKPAAAAGVALYVLLNIVFRSKGAALFKMRAGMGDTIFTPFYKVLLQRGVRFEFFHRVKRLGVSQSNVLVDRIELTRQVKIAHEGEHPLSPYDPLVTVPVDDGSTSLPCWPSEPKWDRIEDGETIKAKLAKEGLTLENQWCDQAVGQPRILRLGVDFDYVVLGISVAALKPICADLIATNTRFAEMIHNVGTVQTQAAQLWMQPTLKALGWKNGSTVMTGYAPTLGSWADMSHLILMEDWNGGPAPGSVEYFCGALPDQATAACMDKESPPTCATAVVEQTGIAWLDKWIGHVWPKAVQANGSVFDWSKAFDPNQGLGVERSKAQYWRANIDLSERYVTSFPGSIKHRLDAGESGFENLFLAGDWIRTRMNSGCFEAAIEGGMRAARAICGSPVKIFGEADHL